MFANGPQGKLPDFNTEPHELEAAAKEKLTDRGYGSLSVVSEASAEPVAHDRFAYASSNAGLGWTDRANREAFYRWRIIPKMLVDTNARDMTVDLFGHKIPAPILFAPIGASHSMVPLVRSPS